jgi:hypothetical protein
VSGSKLAIRFVIVTVGATGSWWLGTYLGSGHPYILAGLIFGVGMGICAVVGERVGIPKKGAR